MVDLTLRACLKIPRGAVFGEKAGWRGATKENTPCGSSTEEQRSQTAFSPKTLRAAGLLSLSSWARSLQPAAGMLRPRRLGQSQNPQPQRPLQFSGRLLTNLNHQSPKILCSPATSIARNYAKLRDITFKAMKIKAPLNTSRTFLNLFYTYCLTPFNAI